MDGFEGDFLKACTWDEIDRFEIVVIAEAGVKEADVGLEELGDGAIFSNEGGDELLRFFFEGEGKGEVEIFETAGVGLGGVDVAEVEPLVGEVLDEAGGLGVGEEAGDLFVEDLGIAEFAFGGELAEGPVGEGFPKEEAEAGGDGVVVERSRFLDEGQEVRGAEDGVVGGADGLREGFAGLELGRSEFLVGGELARGDKAAEGAGSEALDEGIGGGAGLGAAGLVVLGIEVIEEELLDELAGGIGVNALDGDLLEAESGVAGFFEILFSVGEAAAGADEAFEVRFVGFKNEHVAFSHPALEGLGGGLGGGFDDTHVIKEGFVGIAGAGLEGAPKVAIGTGVDRIEVMNGDTIPAVGGDLSADEASGKLKAGVPRDGLAFPELGSAVVSAAVVGDFPGGVFFLKSFVSLEGSFE